jgi:hypothetical protein
MANTDELVQTLFFPFSGYALNAAYKNQQQLTSPVMLNVRLRDVSENMARGGQRPGLDKAFAEQVGDNQPILKLVTINTTYITAI